MSYRWEFYANFLNNLIVYFEWVYGLHVDYDESRFDVENKEMKDLTGRQIRKLRAECRPDIDAIVSSFGPWVIGVDAAPWIWDGLNEILRKLPPDPLNYDVLSYDPTLHGSAYLGDRLVLKELFAGGEDIEFPGQKKNGYAVDAETFEKRATRYLVSLLAQIAQTYRREVAAREGTGNIYITGADTGDETMVMPS